MKGSAQTYTRHNYKLEFVIMSRVEREGGWGGRKGAVCRKLAADVEFSRPERKSGTRAT